jgi:hypothetical protein
MIHELPKYNAPGRLVTVNDAGVFVKGDGEDGEDGEALDLIVAVGDDVVVRGAALVFPVVGALDKALFVKQAGGAVVHVLLGTMSTSGAVLPVHLPAEEQYRGAQKDGLGMDVMLTGLRSILGEEEIVIVGHPDTVKLLGHKKKYPAHCRVVALDNVRALPFELGLAEPGQGTQRPSALHPALFRHSRKTLPLAFDSSIGCYKREVKLQDPMPPHRIVYEQVLEPGSGYLLVGLAVSHFRHSVSVPKDAVRGEVNVYIHV